jgi:hypothetical protein
MPPLPNADRPHPPGGTFDALLPSLSAGSGDPDASLVIGHSSLATPAND